jgi:hypothetical protein
MGVQRLVRRSRDLDRALQDELSREPGGAFDRFELRL